MDILFNTNRKAVKDMRPGDVFVVRGRNEAGAEYDESGPFLAFFNGTAGLGFLELKTAKLWVLNENDIVQVYKATLHLEA